MELLFQSEKLMQLMDDFNCITGLRIVLYDVNLNQLAAFPEKDKSFCSTLRKNKTFCEKCEECNKLAFKWSTYYGHYDARRCHADLIEITVPILDKDRTIGYMQFGRFSDVLDKDERLKQVIKVCKEYNVNADYERLSNSIKYVSQKKMHAVMNNLEVLTSYVQLKEIVRLSGEELISEIDKYITLNIKKRIPIESICEVFHISRTKLYTEIEKYTDLGIATYIRKKRLEAAKHLIETTDMKIYNVAFEVGISDYTHFLKIFKKEYGISPKKYSEKFKHKK